MKIISFLMIASLLWFPFGSMAEAETYAIYDEEENLLTHVSGECEKGDEYISGDNKHYRIHSVDHSRKRALAAYLGSADMPDVSWLDMDNSRPVASIGEKKIALYCTHSDESYIEGDGTESVEGSGGIYDIAEAFAAALKNLGVTVESSDATHLPHDAGAYRRSRETAVKLLKSQPNAIFDIHRDGIPDPSEYETSIGNEKMSMVRLLVGKSNQNKDANLSFAKQIKAVADKIYPGLIKDIYMGKGSYNQDLAPRSVLLEFGTHTLPKELVLRSVTPMSEVVYKALFGGIVGSAGTSDTGGRNTAGSASREQTSPEAENKPAAEDNTGAGWILWLILGLAAGLGVFAFLSAGKKAGMEKWKRSFSEMTGGLLGRKPRDRE